MGVYEHFGVKRRINGAGTLTRLGGTRMAPEVIAAMAEAAESFVDMAELQSRASEVIAHCTGAEAGLVTCGAAAAITLGTAACLTGLDPALMERLPETEGMRNEVIMCRMHRTGYDHAARAAGARIRDIGLNDRGTGAGMRGVEAWEIETAIGPRTAAVAYTAGPAADPALALVVQIAERYGLPVIVDAAAQLPPVANLRRFVEDGASLVAFSGGKAIRGPQASGILCGRRELVAAAMLQQLDMDVSPGIWTPPLVPAGRLHGIPHHGLGRGFKVGKEEIVGLLVALERFVARDHCAEARAQEGQLALIAARLADLPGVRAEFLAPRAAGRPPLLAIRLDEATLGRDTTAVCRGLQQADRPIHLNESRLAEGVLLVNPVGLQAGEEEIVAAALVAALTA